LECQAKIEKPIVIFGAGRIGEQALNFYGRKNVRFFADNFKAGLYYCGFPVLSVDDLLMVKDDYEIIIAALPQFIDEMKGQMNKAGIRAAVYDPALEKKIFAENPRLERFNNIHKGKRCFIIGNGPSLRANDLDHIAQSGDISFASNKIYSIYGQTDWRPDYYFVSDQHFMVQHWNEITEIKENKFLAYLNQYVTMDMLYKLMGHDNVYLFRSRYLQYDSDKNSLLPVYDFFNESYPSFSGDAAKFVFEGFTVTYLMIQWAAYMGFSEMFLLGVDHNQQQTNDYFKKLPEPLTITKNMIGDHFYDEHLNVGEVFNVADLQAQLLAYEKAEQYSHEHGFQIFNATRGGELEIFKRVDFDQLMVRNK
jgi:Predicted nucleoside-diphosphate sugar epimerases